MADTILASVKAAVRVTNSAVEGDFTELINACKALLIAEGVSEEKVGTDGDVETLQACKLYVMWHIDYQSKGDRYKAHFNEYLNFLRSHVEFMEDEADV